MCWGDAPSARLAHQKSTEQICQLFSNDIDSREYVDIYQLMAIISKTHPAGGDKWCIIPLYFTKAVVCFAFQTVMLVLMIVQFSIAKDNKQANNTDLLTKIVACTASLYISVSVMTWWRNILKQGLYRMDCKTFTNCPKYVSKPWLMIGLCANMSTLFIALIGSNILIFWASDAFDVILNCVAIFFMVQIDNEIVGESDYKNMSLWLSGFRNEYFRSTEAIESSVSGQSLNIRVYGSRDSNDATIEKVVKTVAELVATQSEALVTECNGACEQQPQRVSLCYSFCYALLSVLGLITAICALCAPFVITILPYTVYS